MISTAIQQLVNYGLDTGLILPDDEIYIRNQLLMTMQLDDFTAPEGEVCYTDLESILKTLVDDAVARGVCEDNSTARDLFDTKLMGVLTPRPSIVRANFEERYENEGPQAATDWFYKFSQDTDYIRRYRIKRDLKWVTKTEYGDLDITINLSKPEKDPKAIAAAKLAPQSAYPKCQLCTENEGYAGRMNHPARENHRIIPLTINDSAWNLQYSPYVYYNEHCIVFNNQHTPMKIERATFRKLLDFVGLFPHYFVGSNADLPIVGGSILSHDHFQGGHYEFAMAKAPIEKTWVFPGFEDVEAGIVHWPMSCIRLTCADDTRLVELADKLLAAWRGYTDESCFIFAETDGEPHNTITPIARMRDGKYQLDLVLRNNITTPEHPLGVYHPHAKLHHIKKENIGLIEVMGLAVLPSRLKQELFDLADVLVAHLPTAEYPEALQKHAAWAEEILAKHPELNADNVHLILQDEVGHVFAQVLADAGVYKLDEAGRAGFVRFLESVNRGILRIDEPRTYHLTYTLADAFGNATRLSIWIEGKKQEIPQIDTTHTELFHWGSENRFGAKGIRLVMPKGNLYNDLYFRYSVKEDSTSLSATHILHDKPIPLHGTAQLSLFLQSDTLENKQQYGVVRLQNGRASWMGGTYRNGWIDANIKELGSYKIQQDTKAPVITPINQQTWVSKQNFIFRLSDNLSGVQTYRGEIDGQFVLFEMNNKSVITYRFDKERLQRGKHELKLIVTDACGNESIYTHPFTW